jgi:amino acid transporter
MRISAVKKLFVGSPLATAQARHERLSKTSALAVFSSDALSSVAYATEEILLVLVMAGTAALAHSVPIGIAIAILIVVVVSSYRQTILAYPQGGGAYIVTKDNLGQLPGLVAAGALLIDYVLTVAVSVAAGVAAITSAFPWLHGHRIALGVLFIAGIATVNLRGLRESGKLFAIPTYLFVISFGGMLGYGFVRWAAGWEVPPPPAPDALATQGLTVFLVLRAFSSGCAALAANTALADVPRLAYFLARDAFLPRQFATRGDRLVFSNSILILGGLPALLIVLFGGETSALIPLYAVGVFLSFTLSQASMVRRWLTRREAGWRWGLNAAGAATTGVVML